MRSKPLLKWSRAHTKALDQVFDDWGLEKVDLADPSYCIPSFAKAETVIHEVVHAVSLRNHTINASIVGKTADALDELSPEAMLIQEAEVIASNYHCLRYLGCGRKVRMLGFMTQVWNQGHAGQPFPFDTFTALYDRFKAFEEIDRHGYVSAVYIANMVE